MTRKLQKPEPIDSAKTFFTYSPDSALKTWLLDSDFKDVYFTLDEITKVTYNQIKKENLLDSSNTSMIHCGLHEVVFKQSIIHVSQLSSVIQSQLVQFPYFLQQVLQKIQTKKTQLLAKWQLKKQHEDLSNYDVKTESIATPIHFNLDPPFQSVKTFFYKEGDEHLFWTEKMKSDKHFHLNRNARFWLSHGLKTMYKTLEEFPGKRNVFSWKEITFFCSKYILKHKDTLIDLRNGSVINVANSRIMFAAFRVNSFHRCQVYRLLRRLITIAGIIVDNPSEIKTLTTFLGEK